MIFGTCIQCLELMSIKHSGMIMYRLLIGLPVYQLLSTLKLVGIMNIMYTDQPLLQSETLI